MVGLLLVSGCVGSGEGVPDPQAPSGAVPESFSEIQATIFDPMCALQCHQGGAAPKGLSLEAGRSIQALVGAPSAEAPDLLRVAPGDPEASYLIIKLAASDPRRVGARMPRTGPPFLSAGQVRGLRQWIAAGAEEDWVASDDVVDAAFQPPSGGGGDAGPDGGDAAGTADGGPTDSGSADAGDAAGVDGGAP